MQMRYATFVRGNDYVGPNAVKSDKWVNCVYDSLVKEWHGAKGKKEIEFIDVF